MTIPMPCAFPSMATMHWMCDRLLPLAACLDAALASWDEARDEEHDVSQLPMRYPVVEDDAEPQQRPPIPREGSAAAAAAASGSGVFCLHPTVFTCLAVRTLLLGVCGPWLRLR